MQINRLFETIYILLNKKVVTAKELSEHFEISVRTVYRDVETLSQAGIPIYASRGNGGGISLMDDFVLNKSLLSDTEQNQILMGLQGLAVTRYLRQDDTLNKMSSLFHKNDKNWVEVDFSGWGADKSEELRFELLKTAILENKVVSFDYYNSEGEKSKRRVEPVRLIFKNRAWYFYGYCLNRQSYRLFKIGRMSELLKTGETAKLRCEIKSEIENTFTVNEEITLKIKFSKSVAFRVYDEFSESEIEKLTDGSMIVQAVYPYNEWMESYILSYGVDAVVLEPESIRKNIRDKFRKILEEYE